MGAVGWRSLMLNAERKWRWDGSQYEKQKGKRHESRVCLLERVEGACSS